jgi:acyl-coenzyme A thioesterase PaaI-like protein
MSQVTADRLPETPEAWLAWGSQILQTQAFSMLPGAKLTGLDRGSCELSLPITAQHLQQHGFAHTEATGKTQSVCRCNVYVLKEGEEKLCAVAQGTIVPAHIKD